MGVAASALVVAGLAAVPSAADGAATATSPIKEYAQFQTPASFPCEVAIGNDHNLYTDQFTGNSYGKVNPRTGAVSQIPLPNPGGQPGGQNRGPDGDIWFVEVGGNALGRLHPDTGKIDTIPFPVAGVNASIPGLPPLQNGASIPFDDSFGKDGKLYFTGIGINSIGSYDLRTHKFQLFPIPTPASGPVAMEKGPGNTIAITEGVANKVATFDVYTHKWKEYAIPTPATFPAGLSISPDQKYLFFGETFGNKIGRLDFATGKIYEYDLLALRKTPVSTDPSVGNPLPNPGQMRFGSDGRLYFVEGTFSGGNKIGRLDVHTGALKEFATPTPVSSPCDLNNTVPGKMFFAEFTGNRIAYMKIPNTVDVSSTYPMYG